MSYVLGFDASTQSCSATLVNTTSLEVVGELSVNFGADLPSYQAPSGFIPGGTGGEVHSDPLMWLDALDLLFSKMQAAGWPLAEVVALSGSGQQHGSVYLGASLPAVLSGLSATQSLAEQVRPALTRATAPIWMDNSTQAECADIAAALGGNDQVCALTGSIMTERFTGAQIRKFSLQEPQAYEATHFIHLVSSFMASVLAGQSAPIDAGDGAGMNLMNLATADWDARMLAATAPELSHKLPPVAPAGSVIGTVSAYFTERYGLNADCRVYLWSGDNPCSLVGMGASTPGKIVISLGTSYTLFAALPQPLTDPQGYGHVFGNPMGGYMSLTCFMNGSLAREKVREHKDVDWSQYGNDYLQRTPAGNAGKLMLPFYEPEITPALALPAPLTNGWSLEDAPAETQIRACLEGQLLNMRHHTAWMGDAPTEVLVTGGGSKSEPICQTIADVFDANVIRLQNAGSASLGAAIMAAVAADLQPLQTLENALCTLDLDATVQPQHAATYTALLPDYLALLQSAKSA